ncbi:NUDIX hydrolase [Acetohalobium arabaticum DSM 5501]|uniref:NUDIX hydrolase n=1 Tax=Acetohalobium arabaticum (strain ATCC 49924 / DSM 5501 / Z-7288) TaxID=574087 RepID=D9QQH9_ACEAZ|nr:NUDIX domain-containing protein [Acetohalobium arabaticum]ADL12770.1 NUDIX hydrolase [Acetohalobium arabaticum DSM 5501]
MKYPEPTVGAVIFNPDDEILLCKSNKWDNKYVIPGGHIELGERMEKALIREIKEEKGKLIFLSNN